MDPRITSAVRCVVETLETRQLLASISGTFFEDLNNNGQRDGREKPFVNATIFLEAAEDFDEDGKLDFDEDVNGDGNLDPGEDIDADGVLDIDEDFDNDGVIDAPNGRLDGGDISTQTDQNGFWEFTGVPKGRFVVRQVVPKGYGQTLPGPQGQGVSAGSYDLVIRFPDSSISTLIRGLFESAAARWEQVLIGDLPSQLTDIGFVDDMVIDALAANDDGPGGRLAFARPTQLRPEGTPGEFLPVRGEMTFDTADIESQGLYATILHEMGHALGFIETIWSSLGLAQGLNQSAPKFLGENAIREYNRIFQGNDDPADDDTTGVPLEGNISPPGSRNSHWRESIFGNEFMTPYLDRSVGQPFSTATIGLMEDIGYEVEYAAADEYDPADLNPPIIEPGLVDFGVIPFAHTVTIVSDDQTTQGRDFANRLNMIPTLGSLKTTNTLYRTGERLLVKAIGPDDADAGDGPVAANFYLETNGLPGLQIGTGGDQFLAQDNTLAGGFRTIIDTKALGLAPGEYTLYARVYDGVQQASVAKSTTISLFDPTQPPARPSNITAVATSSSVIQVMWADNATTEFGYRLERSTEPNFGARLKKFTLPANTTSFTDTGLSQATRFYYRIRSFNVGETGTNPAVIVNQFSKASGPAAATTLSNGEVVVDSSAPASIISRDGNVVTVTDPNASGGSFLQLTGGSSIARFAPQLQFSGEYFVYARWRPADFSGATFARSRAVFDVTDASNVRTNLLIDQMKRGRENADVLLGKFFFRAGNKTIVRISPDTRLDTVTIDQFRFQPATAVSSSAVAAAASAAPPQRTSSFPRPVSDLFA